MYASCGATALRALINRSSVFEKWARLTDGILAQKIKSVPEDRIHTCH